MMIELSIAEASIADQDRLAPTIETKPQFSPKPRIGIVRRPFFDDLDSEIENAFDSALNEIRVLSSDEQATPWHRRTAALVSS